MPNRPVGNLAQDSLTSRFCYWQSEAGSRYIFSQISASDIPTFENCVLLLAIGGPDHPRIEWIGEISDLSPLALKEIANRDREYPGIYVHLLAGSPEQRQKVITDLADCAGKSDFLLSA